MAYVVPQALVFQEFEVAPTAVATSQQACIIGPRRSLIRYSEVSEKEQGRVGNYNSLVDTVVAWPNKAAGDVVIDSSVRLFIDDALLQYFNNPASGADVIQATVNSTSLQDSIFGDGAVPNVIRASTLVWNGDNRDVSIPCDVQVGDAIRVAAVVGSETVSVTTEVTGFIPEKTPSSIGAAVEDESNISYRAEDASAAAPGVVATAANVDAEDLTVTGSVTLSNSVYETGIGEDSYVLSVLEGGDYNSAIFALVSASGTDNEIGFSLSGAGLGSSEAIGSKNIEVVFDAYGSSSLGSDVFVTGMAWNLAVVFPSADADITSGGEYTGTDNTTYVVRVTRGASFASATKPRITVSTTTGYDYSGPHEVTAGVPVAIGARGVTVTFSGAGGLALNDVFYINATPATEGDIKSIVLADSLPDSLTELVGGSPRHLSVTLYVKKNIEVSRNRVGYAPLVNFDTNETQLIIKSGIIGYDSRVSSSGILLPLAVRGGTVFVEYLATVLSGVGIVGAISDVGQINRVAPVSAALGTVDPANPIAYGVYKALSNVSGGSVLYIQTAGDSLQDYLDALSQLSNRDDVYSLVPMTFDRNVQDAVAAHVNNMSSPDQGRWRICFVCRPAITTEALVGASSLVQATVTDDPTAIGSQNTRLTVTTSGVHLISLGIRPGDVVRTQYETDGFGSIAFSEYVVDAVVSPTQLRLASGPQSSITVATKIEIWRPYSRAEIASKTAINAASFGSRRVYAVWPDYVEVAGELVPGYYLAAAIAGLKSSVLPQQGLTNVELSGFDGVSRTVRLFDIAQLNTMAGSGMTIVTQSPTGQIYIRHSLSTDNSDLNMSELMRTTNLDSISYVMLSRLANFQGKYNITPGLIELIRLSLQQAISGLSITTGSTSIGPQITGLNELTVVQHPIFRDRILVTARLDLPYPNNNTELHLVV